MVFVELRVGEKPQKTEGFPLILLENLLYLPNNEAWRWHE